MIETGRRMEEEGSCRVEQNLFRKQATAKQTIVPEIQEPQKRLQKHTHLQHKYQMLFQQIKAEELTKPQAEWWPN